MGARLTGTAVISVGENIVTTNGNTFELGGGLTEFIPYTPPLPIPISGEQCPCCGEKWKRRQADKGEKGDRRKRPKRRKKAGD